jgi:thiol-disulfide isomerase/thioredoxin
VKRNPVVLVVIALIVALMLWAGIRQTRRKAGPSPEGSATAMKGKVAPDFSLVTLDGKPAKLSDFRGKAVLLNFWATWCEPCKIEMPWFVDFQKQYGPQGLQIVGVAMDDADTKDIAKFAQDMHVDYPILVGKDDERESIANAYGGVQFLPETLYLDRDGKILNKMFGLVNRSEIEDNIKKAMASGNASSGE